MNKKADKLLTIWWFLILVIIGMAVVTSTVIFSSNRMDIRILEADALATKVIQCLSGNGLFSEDFMKQNFDISLLCGISEKALASGNYFIKVSIYDSTNKLVSQSSYGNNAFEGDCSVGNAMVQASNYPRCSYQSISMFNSKNEKFNINIIAGSNSEHRAGA